MYNFWKVAGLFFFNRKINQRISKDLHKDNFRFMQFAKPGDQWDFGEKTQPSSELYSSNCRNVIQCLNGLQRGGLYVTEQMVYDLYTITI